MPLACFAVMLPAFLLGLGWRLQEATSGRLSPLGVHRLWALALLGVIAPATGLVVVAIKRQLKLRTALTLVALLLLGLVGGGALVIALDPKFPFTDDYLLSALSPDGRDQGHVYLSSFIGCSYALYRGPANAMFVEAVSSESIDCARQGAVEVHWPSDGGVELSTDARRPAPWNLFGPWH